MSMRHDLPLKAWLVQRNRKIRQNAEAPVVFAQLGSLETNVSPALIPHPPITFEGGTNYESVTWASSDESVLNFDTEETHLRFALLKAGTVAVTLTFNNKDGSTEETTQIYTII